MLSERSTRWAKKLARFLSLEVFVQALGFAAGIMLVRLLPKDEYAFFTVAVTIQGTMNMLCDNGVGAGISGIGGGVWQDRHRFGSLITTAMKLRLRQAILTAIIVTPILFALLLRKEATPVYAAVVTAAVLVGLYFQITIGVLGHVPHLHLKWKETQRIGLWSSALRLSLLGVAYFTLLDAATAVLASTITFAAVHFQLHRWMPEMIDTKAPENEGDRRQLSSMIKTQAPNAIFFCFQSQITIWLISYFGKTTDLADVGALSRLAAIFSVVSSAVGSLVVPHFIRCRDASQLWWRYWQIVGIIAGFGALLVVASIVVPDLMLWVLGEKYSYLKSELLLLVISSVLGVILNTMWVVNGGRAWMMPPLVSIPLNLATQILLVVLLDVTTLRGILLMGIFSNVPGMILNLWVTSRGIRQFRDHPTAVNTQ